MTSASFAVFSIQNSLGRSRLGLTVTRKFGKAVLRNRRGRIARRSSGRTARVRRGT
jgi:ribonuclease P protein component